MGGYIDDHDSDEESGQASSGEDSEWGFSVDELHELAAQGVSASDEDAHAVLDVLFPGRRVSRHGIVAADMLTGLLGPRCGADNHPPSQPEPDAEWKQRGAKMLKKMGWSEGEGLGRHSAGITAPLETHVQTGRGGLGLAAEVASKVVDRISVNVPHSRSGGKDEGVSADNSDSQSSGSGGSVSPFEEYSVHWLDSPAVPFTTAERERWERVCRFLGTRLEYFLKHEHSVFVTQFLGRPAELEFIAETAKSFFGLEERKLTVMFPKDMLKLDLSWYDIYGDEVTSCSKFLREVTYFLAIMFPGRLRWNWPPWESRMEKNETASGPYWGLSAIRGFDSFIFLNPELSAKIYPFPLSFDLSKLTALMEGYTGKYKHPCPWEEKCNIFAGNSGRKCHTCRALPDTEPEPRFKFKCGIRMSLAEMEACRFRFF